MAQLLPIVANSVENRLSEANALKQSNFRRGLVFPPSLPSLMTLVSVDPLLIVHCQYSCLLRERQLFVQVKVAIAESTSLVCCLPSGVASRELCLF